MRLPFRHTGSEKPSDATRNVRPRKKTVKYVFQFVFKIVDAFLGRQDYMLESMNGNPLNTSHGDNSHGNGWSRIRVVFEVIDNVFELVGVVFEFVGAFF